MIKFAKYIIFFVTKIILISNFSANAFQMDHQDNKLLLDGGKILIMRPAYSPSIIVDPYSGEKDLQCNSKKKINNRGFLQAQRLGNYLKKKKIKIKYIFSSQYCNASQTAFILKSKLKTKVKINDFFDELKVKDINKNYEYISDFKKYIQNNKTSESNIIFITHHSNIQKVFNVNLSWGQILLLNYKLENIKIIDFR